MDTMVLHKGERFERVFVNTPVDLHIVQEEGSTVRIHVIHLPSEPCDASEQRHVIRVEQRGACRTELYGLMNLHGNEQATVETHVYHETGGGVSDQLVKFVLRDEAKGRFVGDLRIRPDAQQVEAHQTNRNLLLSDDAVMRTMPQLEIYADDVKATHGASTGQLDESALFYMQQRGIDVQRAREMLVAAFMKDVLNTIADEALRERLLTTVDGEIE